MKQQDVFRKIGGIIREINEQYQYLAGAQDQLNDLELELLKANAHFLSDHIEVLRKVISQKPEYKPEAFPLPTPVAEKPATAPELPEPVVPAAEPVVAPEPVAVTLQPAPVDLPTEQNTADVDEQLQQPEPEKKPEPKYFEPVVERVPVYASAIQPGEEESEPRVVEFDMPKPQREAEPAGELEEEQNEDVAADDPKEQEKEIIRHELTIDEAGDDWDEEDEEFEDAPEPEPVEEVSPEPEPEPELSEPEPVAEIPVPAKEEPQYEPAKPAATEPARPVESEELITFNQKISAQMGASSRMSDQLGGQTISDLKSAISLNDKLLYVKDLFNGYSLAYSEALEILNTRFRTFEEAENFLKPYASKNSWADKTATADKFYNLLRRRYGV